MKKLFSTMLAATMVAGMAVTAFAEIGSVNPDTTKPYTTGFFGDNDYAVIGAYDEDGNKIKEQKSSKVDGGDKIYFPILISGDEIDKDETTKPENKDNMYFADKASEVKNLKASVKDEIGGKYIDSAAIVKKDIKIGNAGTQVTAGVSKVDAVAPIQHKFTVDLTGVTVDGTAKAADGTETVELKIGSTTISATGLTVGDITVGDLATALATKGMTGYTAAAVGSTITFTQTTAADASTESAVTFAVTGGTLKTTANVATIAEVQKGVTEVKAVVGSPAVSAMGKIYCVEVKMADYFKNEETEVEFNIQLKDSGKTEYNTDDDNKLFYATFDLGKDSDMFDLSNANSKTEARKGETVVIGKDFKNGAKATKFKNGDLEIEIGKDTKTLQLDEAVTSANKKEDITNIYIENDKSIDNAFTFDVKASSQDDLYLELNQDAIKDLAVSNSKADLTFFNFPGTPEFDFSGEATFAVEDEDEDNYFYEVVDGELVESRAKYNKEDGTFELRTNKLGSYVISDKELKVSEGKEENDAENKEQEGTGGDASSDATANTNGGKDNANTGAADLIGVASALAVVSIAAAGVVALKK